MTYEAPDITSITEVTETLIGTVGSGGGATYYNPQWNEDPDDVRST